MKAELMHALQRTSPKGGPFIGTCMKCGKTGLTSHDQMTDECPNPAGMDQNTVLLHAIIGNPRQ